MSTIADPIVVEPAVASSPERRFFDRYRRPDYGPPTQWNETLDVLLAHRSVRRFAPDALAPRTLEALVGAAQSAPSSSNLQIWSVVAVEDAARKERLAALAGDQQWIRRAPLFLIWLIDHQRLRSIAGAQGREADGLSYTESFLLGGVDTALAAQNATIAAESMGLGAVYIGAIRNDPAGVAAELGLPPHVFPLFGMAVGRPDPDHPADVKPRLPQEAVLFREQYAWTDRHHAAATSYDEKIRSFQREQGMAELDWTVQAVNRTAGWKSLAGRHVLGLLGFELR
jgi:nitroreductase